MSDSELALYGVIGAWQRLKCEVQVGGHRVILGIAKPHKETR